MTTIEQSATPGNAPEMSFCDALATSRKLAGLAGTPLGGLYALFRNRLRMADPVNSHDALSIRFADATMNEFNCTFANPEDKQIYTLTVKRIG